MGTVSISENEIVLTYPHGEKFVFQSTKSTSSSIKEYLVFEGVNFYLTETKG